MNCGKLIIEIGVGEGTNCPNPEMDVIEALHKVIRGIQGGVLEDIEHMTYHCTMNQQSYFSIAYEEVE